MCDTNDSDTKAAAALEERRQREKEKPGTKTNHLMSSDHLAEESALEGHINMHSSSPCFIRASNGFFSYAAQSFQINPYFTKM